jgi:hypothetical protein
MRLVASSVFGRKLFDLGAQSKQLPVLFRELFRLVSLRVRIGHWQAPETSKKYGQTHAGNRDASQQASVFNATGKP